MGAFSRTLFVLLIAVLASASLGETNLDISAGYSDRYRPGRWVPVTVTVQSDQPRSGIIELRVPNASASTMTIRQQIGIGKDEQSYILYAPLALQSDPLTATLYDADGGKALADWPPSNTNFNARLGLMGEQVNFAILTTGRTPMLQGYRRGGIQGVSLVDHLRPFRLPTTPIGYDAADVLILNDPDWSTINADQQRAMIAWVRAGGTLLLWPGVNGIPQDAPLAAILPATVGEPATLQIPPAQLQAAGLAPRFASLAFRPLTPTPQTTAIPLLDDQTSAIVGRVGLGQIALLPIDAGILQFNSNGTFGQFWDGFFNKLLPAGAQQEQSYYNTPDIDAAAAGLDRIGDIPNTGAFGFTYVVVLIGAMMLLVGPVDYLVLKKIGHQPWTWGTTLGWIGLITVAAIYAGRLLRSGDLHFRTLRLIEQAGDVTSESALALVYAPRSSTYSITAGDGWWWQPVPTGNRYRADTIGLPLDTYQSATGNHPEKMWIEVWNWRFLQGKRMAQSAPRIDATLTASGRQVKGEISNLGPHALKKVQIETRNYIGDAGDFAPAEKRTIDLSLEPKEGGQASDTITRQLAVMPAEYRAVFNIDSTAAAGIEAALARGATIVYAEIVDPDSDIAIDQAGARTQHKAYLRAVIEPPASSPGNPGEG